MFPTTNIQICIWLSKALISFVGSKTSSDFRSYKIGELICLCITLLLALNIYLHFRLMLEDCAGPSFDSAKKQQHFHTSCLEYTHSFCTLFYILCFWPLCLGNVSLNVLTCLCIHNAVWNHTSTESIAVICPLQHVCCEDGNDNFCTLFLLSFRNNMYLPYWIIPLPLTCFLVTMCVAA